MSCAQEAPCQRAGHSFSFRMPLWLSPLGSGSGPALFMCASAGWTWALVCAAMYDLTATTLSDSSFIQDCPLSLHMDSALWECKGV